MEIRAAIADDFGAMWAIFKTAICRQLPGRDLMLPAAFRHR
jgi:hypothetical protein